MTDRFEERIRELTAPINGQLPRPWMTDMKNPQEADVFIVGMNQSREYPVDEITHEKHIDALFDRNGQCCRALYDEVTTGKPSPTRRNIDRLTDKLNRQGVEKILETNVICYSTPMSRNLRNLAHAEDARRGDDIFRYLLEQVQPPVLIVRGAAARKELSKIIRMDLPEIPKSVREVCDVQTGRHLVIPIPSLALPEFNKWKSWSSEFLDLVAARVSERLA